MFRSWRWGCIGSWWHCHIDCGTNGIAHGIVGENTSSAKPINCLFLGTMSQRTTPLWDGSADDSGCYCDVNLYDDEGDRPEYLSFSKLTSGGNVGFKNSTTIYIDWRYIFGLNDCMSFEYNPANDWVFEAGFYPRLQMTEKNLTYEYMVNRVNNKEGEDITRRIDLF